MKWARQILRKRWLRLVAASWKRGDGAPANVLRHTFELTYETVPGSNKRRTSRKTWVRLANMGMELLW